MTWWQILFGVILWCFGLWMLKPLLDIICGDDDDRRR
jgi:hypothetical protein